MKIQSNIKEIVDALFNGDALAYLNFWGGRRWQHGLPDGTHWLQFRAAVIAACK